MIEKTALHDIGARAAALARTRAAAVAPAAVDVDFFEVEGAPFLLE